jgi:hypothetical protein
VHKTLQALSTDADAGVRLWAQRFKQWITTGRLVLSSHWFWTAPLAFWEMPEHLRQELANASLVVIKGDANYRRLLGDRQWPFTTPFPAIVCYFPTPLLALRTLKSEVVAGLSPTQIKTVTQDDPEWLINGHWGLIQWANPASPDLVPG